MREAIEPVGELLSSAKTTIGRALDLSDSISLKNDVERIAGVPVGVSVSIKRVACQEEAHDKIVLLVTRFRECARISDGTGNFRTDTVANIVSAIHGDAPSRFRRVDVDVGALSLRWPAGCGAGDGRPGPGFLSAG